MGIQETNGITSSKNGRGCKAVEKVGKMNTLARVLIFVSLVFFGAVLIFGSLALISWLPEDILEFIMWMEVGVGIMLLVVWLGKKAGLDG